MLRRGKGSEEGHVTGKQRWGANLPSPVPTQEEGLSVSLTPGGAATQPQLSPSSWWRLRRRRGIPWAARQPAAQPMARGHRAAAVAQPSLLWGLPVMGDLVWGVVRRKKDRGLGLCILYSAGLSQPLATV